MVDDDDEELVSKEDGPADKAVFRLPDLDLVPVDNAPSDAAGRFFDSTIYSS